MLSDFKIPIIVQILIVVGGRGDFNSQLQNRNKFNIALSTSYPSSFYIQLACTRILD